jgi:hypothetical protein
MTRVTAGCPFVEGGRIAILTIAERCVEPGERLARLAARGSCEKRAAGDPDGRGSVFAARAVRATTARSLSGRSGAPSTAPARRVSGSFARCCYAARTPPAKLLARTLVPLSLRTQNGGRIPTAARRADHQWVARAPRTFSASPRNRRWSRQSCLFASDRSRPSRWRHHCARIRQPLREGAPMNETVAVSGTVASGESVAALATSPAVKRPALYAAEGPRRTPARRTATRRGDPIQSDSCLPSSGSMRATNPHRAQPSGLTLSPESGFPASQRNTATDETDHSSLPHIGHCAWLAASPPSPTTSPSLTADANPMPMASLLLLSGSIDSRTASARRVLGYAP